MPKVSKGWELTQASNKRDEAPLCFISYARHSNLDRRLGRFVHKLEEQLPAHLPHGTNLNEVIFFDIEKIETADQWMDRLSEATRRCKVCVCFYSQPYFTSPYCGREVQVFLQRVRAWQQQKGNATEHARAIVPVVWVPHDPLPEVLKEFHYDSRDFPDRYLKEGLLGLAMRKNDGGAYNIVLDKLARQIADTSQRVDLPEGAPIASFETLTSAFDTAKPTRYGAAVMFLTSKLARSQPFTDGRASLDATIESIANRNKIPIRELKIGNGIAQEIAACNAAREMPVLIADRAMLESPLNKDVVTRLGKALNEAATVLVFGDPFPSAAEAIPKLRAALNKVSTSNPEIADRACLVATNLVELDALLEQRLSEVRRRLIEADPPARAEDAVLQALAKAQGIAVDAQPILTGPGT